MTNFSCTHCGKSFQLESSKPEECPYCFWGSGIIKIAPGEESKPNLKAPKKTSHEWIILLAVLVGCIVIALIGMHFAPTNTAPSTPPSSPYSDTRLAILFGLLALIWAGLQKIWPFLLGGFVMWCFYSIAKDAVSAGVKDALSDYSVREELKETIRDAIEENKNKNDWDDD